MSLCGSNFGESSAHDSPNSALTNQLPHLKSITVDLVSSATYSPRLHLVRLSHRTGETAVEQCFLVYLM